MSDRASRASAQTRAEWLATRPQLGGLGLNPDFTASQLYKRLTKLAAKLELYMNGVYVLDLDTWLHWAASDVSFDDYKEQYPQWNQPKWRHPKTEV